jgi:type VI secretion system protein VasI
MRSISIAMFVCATAVTSSSLAQEAPKNCAQIRGTFERLECYDVIFQSPYSQKAQTAMPSKTAPPSEPAKSVSTTETPSTRLVSNWTGVEGRSKMDDTKRYVATVDGERINLRYNKQPVPQLVIRCMESKTAFYIDWGAYLGIGRTRVTWRIDTRAPHNAAMDISTDSNAAGFWSGKEAIDAVRALKGGTKLVARITPYSESPVETTFQIEGADRQVDEVAKTCRW